MHRRGYWSQVVGDEAPTAYFTITTWLGVAKFRHTVIKLDSQLAEAWRVLGEAEAWEGQRA